MINYSNKSIITKPFIFIKQWRSLPFYELISYFFMFASVVMLAYGIKQYNITIIKIIIFTILSLYSGFFASLIWNDITDYDIDAIAHPDRPIPSGKINKKNFFIIALIFSFLTFIFAFLISIWCLFLVGISALFVFLHNKYLKRKVNIPAFSEIFGPLQWTVMAIFGFFSIWTSFPISSEIYLQTPIGNISTSIKEVQQLIILILFIYFADCSHDIVEGIHDLNADIRYNVKTYASSFGVQKAFFISVIMFIISGIFGIIFYFQSILSPVFLCIFLILFFYTLFYELKLLKSRQKINEYGLIAGRKLYNYFLFFFDIIFLDIIIQILYNYFL